MSESKYNFTLPATAGGQRCDLWLSQNISELSRARIQNLIEEGLVTLDGRPLKASTRLVAGRQLTVVVPPPQTAVPQAQDLPLTIIYEDSDLLVLDKPAALVVHPAPGHADGTLVNALLHHCRDLAGVGGVLRPGIVHRLDKETSGLMVIAKNDRAMAGLVAYFKSGAISKGYLALVHGHPAPAQGVIETLIGRHPRDRKKMAVVTRNGKRAITRYAITRLYHNTALIEAFIDTGRTHQIRVHLAHLGHPLAGDQLYGSRQRDRLLTIHPQRQMLHAARLSFAHPVTHQPLSFYSRPPADMQELLQALSLDAAPKNMTAESPSATREQNYRPRP